MQIADWPQSIVDLDAGAVRADWSEEDRARLWSTHDLMAVLFAGRMRGSGRTFLSHLAGTAGLALEHGASVDEVLAGYAHAAYDHGDFGRVETGPSAANRSELRAAVGTDAEALVFRYSGLDWDARVAAGIDAIMAAKDPLDRRIYFLRCCNALDDAVDYNVHSGKVREGFREEITVGSEVMAALGFDGLAERMRGFLATLPEPGAAVSGSPRSKRPQTLRNRAFRTNQVLRLRRDPRGVLAAIRRRLGL